MKDLKCLRCEREMEYMSTEKIQLGQTGWILGDLSNLISGAMEVHIYMCPKCGKIEFFAADGESYEDGDRIAQIRCPECGKKHDMDYPKCPFCKHQY